MLAVRVHELAFHVHRCELRRGGSSRSPLSWSPGAPLWLVAGADVPLGYRHATQPGCVPTFIAPADCPFAPDAPSNTCTRAVTVTCDSGEVDTVTITWAGGCVPQVHSRVRYARA